MFPFSSSRLNIPDNGKIPMCSLQYLKKSIIIRKKCVKLIIFIVANITIIRYIMNKLSELNTTQPIIMLFAPADNNISCHYIDDSDALPSAENKNFSPKSNSIFFLETSCRGGLNSRQACAIESASRAHPKRQVYVMFSAPVSDIVYLRSCIAILRRLPNVKFARIHITAYAKNTPLEAMIAGEPFKESRWRVEHSSDVLRYLTLYKWGGVYLDTDMIVVKSLTPLGHNWVAKQDKNLVNTAATAMSMDDVGRRFVEALIHEVNTTFRPDIWMYNGPGAITRVLEKLCGTAKLADWSSSTCQGFEVYGPEYFYPVHYSSNNKYFKSGKLKDVDKAYIHHFWNKITHDKIIEKDSPYAKLAKEFCPNIYEMYGDEFGS